ncbi:MAG: hypothetical protein DI533_22085 [Cereibacter sphaeroides]|uniref:Flagellar protein FliL n=1 Tax=Cereibacter sphaeroides TaxID=1063 RepID=A0A2W5S344_CERSP|nr:MAG: hypothetical protein DI533_22085 [Cereibacter sphaeroides]
MRGYSSLFALLMLAATQPVQASSGGAGDAALVPMEAISVPIVDSDRLIGKLRFKLVLQAHDAGAASRIGAMSAQLRTAALNAGIEFARLEVTPTQAVDVAALSHLLDTALRQAAPGLDKVLIVEVSAVR